MVTTALEQQAQILLDKGYWPFPVKDKVPLLPFRNSTNASELALVHSHMTHWAVRTGKEQNLFVVDQDGGDRPNLLGISPSQKTPHGWHWCFAFPEHLEGGNSVKPVASFDTRGDGGYIVVYEPENLPIVSGLAKAPETVLGWIKKRDYAGQGWVERALSELGKLPRRQTFLRVAGKLWRGGLGEGDIMALLTPHANAAGTELSELQRIVGDVSKYPQPPKPTIKTFGADWGGYVKALEERKQRQAPELPTGFRSLDSAMWGLRRGDIVTVGARTGVGKTSFALTLTNHLTAIGKKVLYASTEMDHDEIFSRLVAINVGVDSFNLLSGQTTEEENQKLTAFDPKTFADKVLVFDSFQPSLLVLADAIEDHSPDILVVDSIQHAENGKRDNRVLELEEMVVGLKQLARKHNVAVIITSQLGRDAEARDPKSGKFPLPSLRHLKWCGAIEEESSQVILLSRATEDFSDTSSEEVILNLLKNRRGRTAFLTLKFERTFNRFSEE